MTHPRTVGQLLPDRADEIDRLRRTNPVFAEICEDYETMTEFEQAGHADDSIVIECLDGLEEEILRHLARHAGRK